MSGAAATPYVTRDDLERGLIDIGLAPGQLVMAHARLSSFGWVVGGAQTLVEALLAVVGPTGTLVAYAGWEDNPYHLAEWPPERQQAYRRGMPPFDPEISEARRSHGRLAERLRTWPDARRSGHPEANLVAVGAQAAWVTADSPDCDANGPSSPLARVADAGGFVVMLGAPLNTVTLIHLAEGLSRAEPKRRRSYAMPVRSGGGVVWREFKDIDTSLGAYDYDHVLESGQDYVEVIARDALDAGVGWSGYVCSAATHVFPAPQLRDFAVAWLEERFGPGLPT